MVCLCSGSAPRINHLAHNQQISRSTLIGNISFYQLFITFHRISFKNMESLVSHTAKRFFAEQAFGRVCAAWKSVSLEIFLCSIYLWFSLRNCYYWIFCPFQHHLLANSYFGLESTSKGKHVGHSWKMIAVNARVLVSALQTSIINLN